MGADSNERKHTTLLFDLCETDMTAVPATSAQTGLTARRRVFISPLDKISESKGRALGACFYGDDTDSEASVPATAESPKEPR